MAVAIQTSAVLSTSTKMVFHYRVRAGVTVVIALVLAQCVAEGAHAPCRVEKSENVSLFLCSRYFHGGLVLQGNS